MSEDQPTPPDVYGLLRLWDDEHGQPNYDPIPHLTAMAEIIEAESEAFMKMDPDPFDERHPSRAYPNSTLGYTLKVLFRKEQFMNKLVNDYMRDNYYSRLGIQRDVRKLNIAACRLMLDITPGLETSAVFEMPTNDALIQRLFAWAENSVEPLQTYATGLLAAAMDVQEIAVVFREQNLRLVPLMLKRLRAFQLEFNAENKNKTPTSTRPFAHLGSADGHENTPNGRLDRKRKREVNSPRKKGDEEPKQGPKMNGSVKKDQDDRSLETPRRPSVEGMMSPPRTKPSPYSMSDCSNSSWAEMESFVIGSVQMSPLTLATKQMFILRYLTPMGEYQEFLSSVFENNALDLIMELINLRTTKHARLSFEALKYLASLLCHKKFSIEFITVQGLQRLLEVPRPSIAATGVSICLYYLAYCEDAMERVCLLPQHVLSDLVRYALWLLECSHDSGRCHATMFFGLSFQFQVILEEFDAQDGLRKLYNVISTLPILTDDSPPMNDDEECSARQIVRQVSVALKRYLEAHLYIRSEQVRRAHLRDISSEKMHSPTLPSYKACRSSPEQVREQINTLLEFMSFKASWAPVDEFLRLGGINLLLTVIAFAYDWNYSGRGETVRSSLDVLGICSVMPKVQMQLCEKVGLPEDPNAVGINVILSAAEGEIVSDPDVQRSALQVLITIVCAPIFRVGGSVVRFSSSVSTKKKTRSSEEVVEKMWDCVRTSNGVMVLLALIQLKAPLTDADSVRSLACQAMAGLARSETVRQIIGKLPLFTTGQLQSLMKDPIRPDRRQEHALFQKYAMELLERVSGKTKPRSELEPTLSNIHRASVIAQTRIQFNDRDLLQVIQQHLLSHGMTESAEVLGKEAGLPPVRTVPPPLPAFHSSFNSQRSNSTPTRPRGLSLKSSTPSTLGNSSVKTPTLAANNVQTPIRLNISSSHKKSTDARTSTTETPPSGRCLEKKTFYDRVENQIQQSQPSVTLDSIVAEYLMSQHANCKNPMATCPQFNLFEPHKCPEPKARHQMYGNFTLRHARGMSSRRHDNRLIHSRFCTVHIFRYGGENAFFTSVDFFGNDKYVVIGSHQGEVKLFNLCNGTEVSSYHCHESYISHLMSARKSPLLLTSSTWRQPLSACWSIKDNIFHPVLSMQSEDYVEFNKITEDRIIGTKNDTATIYDIETKALLQTLKPSISNQYTKNKATFSPNNELVLSDGVLWDVNSGKHIHKLDKLNQSISGVFHPNGVEIVSNTEVWDLRTFHLLRTVPTLDQSDILFDPTGYTIFSVACDNDNEVDTTFDNSFKTLDAYDYSSIATIDVKKNIHDFACNGKDTQIAIVENQGTLFDSMQESIVKIYDIGRLRITDDDVEEEDDDDDMEASEGSNTDDDQQNDDTLPMEIFDDTDDDTTFDGGQSDSSSSTTTDEDAGSVHLSGVDDDDDDDADFF
ncbi:LisH [Nesidiocoris tenuis]|uniref:LisH n=1 Tax=Nesidiocoris tenuis TaxID=355587 RepID=A0ABN7B9E0_9HEMI|nr:LisH [Nesidiocoris tenuis]